ncbi:MAG: TolC family outer membrane protein [Marinosulfonomonas sp.]|nr:TolC family outer membrane protein [Marinosulfonomonas sp.]
MRAAKFAIAVIAATLISSAGARAETLGDALVQAYNQSGLLHQNRALLRAADEDVAATVALLRPVIGYVVGANYSSITRTTTANVDLTASLLLYDFGRSRLRKDVAKENVLALREALIGVEQQVLLGAVVAYTSVQRDGAIVGLRDNNVRLITQELRAAKDRFDVGEITRTDVAIAEARLASARSLRAAAQGNLARSRESYRAATGAYPGALAPRPTPPATASSLQSARSMARSRHPDVLQAQRSVTLAELNIALAMAGMKPSLRADARASLVEGGNETQSVGVTLSGPIYQGGGLASSARKAAAMRDASKAGLHLTRLGVDQEVGNAWASLVVAEAAVQATDQQIRAARVAFRGVREEASLGARTTLDVLNAEQELLDAEANKVSAESDRYVAVYRVLSSMGLLTANHLKLGVATYDPVAYYNTVKSAPAFNVSPQGEKLDRVLKSLGKF